jgi:hypothetical protein
VQQWWSTAAALTRSRAYRYEFLTPREDAYIFWDQIHSYSQTKQTILTVTTLSLLGEKKGAYFMKAKTDVKAGFTVNVAKNIAIVRQKGYYNVAYVSQIAVAASS